jgi:hypothetical protein
LDRLLFQLVGLRSRRLVPKPGPSRASPGSQGWYRMSGLDHDFEVAIDAALEQMRATIIGAIDAAQKAHADIQSAAGSSVPPPSRQFFASCVMQLGYCVQCDADIKTFEGGDSATAWHAIKNAVDLSNHYWESRFELRRE